MDCIHESTNLVEGDMALCPDCECFIWKAKISTRILFRISGGVSRVLNFIQPRTNMKVQSFAVESSNEPD